MVSKLRISMLALLFVTTACGDDEVTSASSDSATDATTTDAATDATGDATETGDSTATSDEAPTTGGSTTQDDVSTTGDPTTMPVDTTGDSATGETTDDTAGPVDPELVSACEAYCERWAECGLQPDLAGCVAGCSDSFQGGSEACVEANKAALACTTALDCEGLLGSIEDPGAGPCGAESEAAADACYEAGCSQSVGGSETECELSYECPDAPLQEMKCAGDTCTCFEGGEVVGQCAADGVCAEGDAIFDKAASCCELA